MDLSIGEKAEYVKQLVFMHKQSYVIDVLEWDLTEREIEAAKKKAIEAYWRDSL